MLTAFIRIWLKPIIAEVVPLPLSLVPSIELRLQPRFESLLPRTYNRYHRCFSGKVRTSSDHQIILRIPEGHHGAINSPSPIVDSALAPSDPKFSSPWSRILPQNMTANHQPFYPRRTMAEPYRWRPCAYSLRHWYNLSDGAMEDACTKSPPCACCPIIPG